MFLCTSISTAQTDSSFQNQHAPISSSSPPGISNDSIPFSPSRFTLVAGGTAGLITLAHLQNYNSWWKGKLGPFHLGEDGTKYLHADKFGHLYFTYITSDLVRRSLIWSGVQRENALWYGAGLALAFQLYVEVEDGFHPELGFSLGDATADITGAAFPLLQRCSPVIAAISIKWSANPSLKYKEGKYRTLIDDYESQVHPRFFERRSRLWG